MSLAVVPTGTANMASVLAAFRRLGAAPIPVTHPEAVMGHDHVVVPGVGAFGAAMGEIDRQGLREALTERITRGLPTLAICVGMQILATSSNESEGVPGLGILDAEVTRFGEGVLTPQMGWNRVEPGPGCRMVTPGWAYFANSYRISAAQEGWASAETRHGDTFVSALERGSVLACQFHPELSGEWGSGLMRRWLDLEGMA